MLSLGNAFRRDELVKILERKLKDRLETTEIKRARILC